MFGVWFSVERGTECKGWVVLCPQRMNRVGMEFKGEQLMQNNITISWESTRESIALTFKIRLETVVV